jgi:ComF family protein
MLVCGGCLSRFSPLPFPQCVRCGQPLSPGIACRLCLGWPEGLGNIRSAVWLEGGARRAVHLLKYEGWWRLGEPLALAIQRALPLPREIILVPIPLSAGRERARGYNQSAMIAESLGHRLGVRVRQVLRRGRDTGTQTALTPEARRANLAGAFTAAERSPEHPVLVDDVFTTGATLAEAATALLMAGAVTVTGVTFARAVRPLADAQAMSSSR